MCHQFATSEFHHPLPRNVLVLFTDNASPAWNLGKPGGATLLYPFLGVLFTWNHFTGSVLNQIYQTFQNVFKVDLMYLLLFIALWYSTVECTTPSFICWLKDVWICFPIFDDFGYSHWGLSYMNFLVLIFWGLITRIVLFDYMVGMDFIL